jgi:hypothetical protein
MNVLSSTSFQARSKVPVRMYGSSDTDEGHSRVPACNKQSTANGIAEDLSFCPDLGL